MYDDGYKHITNIDFSTVVIENMRTRCADRSEMKCEYRKMRYVLMIPSNTPGDLCLRIHLRFCPKGLEMDIRALKFDDLSFDIILDKGTMDALMCDRGDVWSPDEELIRAVKGEVDEVVRVLKLGGKFIYITSTPLPEAALRATVLGYPD
ncbi:hypothetical protein BC936DRAFT_142031 [Jimgerdemannia flammicorona]|uniref:Uncharacterized protein n=1 Tax=Jimgerdemannia flammicorona TaxID=994334 RepID=A0A433A171_9FUNG|nr:hypothetical protein BC936DRAFT_142031 [Jimgerdemannia flammicorona]